jgi:hypothetical protein
MSGLFELLLPELGLRFAGRGMQGGGIFRADDGPDFLNDPEETYYVWSGPLRK